MSTSKKHHFVPRGILCHFTTRPGSKQICGFDKKTGHSFTANLAEVASENYFNTLDFDGQRISIEEAFEHCDDKLAGLVRTLVRTQRLDVLSKNDREDLAVLAAIQFYRVKLIRTSFLEMPRQFREALQERGTRLTPELARQIAVGENDARVLSIRQLLRAEELAPHFLKKDWALCVAPPSNPFWISDNPIVLANLFPYGKRGLASPGVEVCWPLGSDVLLSFRCPVRVR